MSAHVDAHVVARRPRSVAGHVAVLVLGAIGLGLAIGVATAIGQAWLTGSANAIVNSESAWLVAPFAVGAVAGRPAAAAALGLLTCVMQLVGYELCDQVRYGALALGIEWRWAVAALAGGTVFGLAGWAWRSAASAWRGLGPAALAAAFLTEGWWVYLHRLHQPGEGALWIVIGVAIALAGMRRGRDWGWLGLALVAGLLVQVATTWWFG